MKDYRLLQALRKESLDRPPAWMMRQAGRYLPEYRALKEKYSFLELCKSPELATEVTLQPMRRFKPDASIIFADILLPIEPLGFDLTFNPGPKIGNPIKTPEDVSRLKPSTDNKGLQYVCAAISQCRGELESLFSDDEPRALFGFAGAPWTMSCYLTHQGIFKHFLGTQVFAARYPQAFTSLIDILTNTLIDYLIAQVEAGAHAIQLFDTWAGNLTQEDYRRLALPSTQKIIEAVKKTGCPVVLYANGCNHLIGAMLESGADALSVDARTSLANLNPTSCIQGNLDSTLLFSSETLVREHTRSMLNKAQRFSGYIANLGHGVLPETPIENVAAFFDEVKKWRA